MKKLDRYVLRELWVPFLIGTLAVVLMFQANTLIYYAKTFSLSAVPLDGLLKLITYRTPEYLNMTLPIGMSLAASLAISRLTRESELTAMRAAGARILRVCMPIMAFGLAVSVLDYYVADRVMPSAAAEVRKLETQLTIRGMAPEFKSNVVVNLRNYVANFGSVARGKENVVQLNHVVLFERPRAGETQIYTATTGEYRDGIWRLHDYRVWIVKEDGDLTLAKSKKPGGSFEINEPIVIESFFQTPQPPELTTEELVKAINEGKKTGMDTTSMQIAYHVRYAVPATCLIFAIVAPVFAVFFARSGGFIGILLSLFLIFLYYNAHIISTQVLGPNGFVPPWLAAWLPTFIFLVFGLIGIRRLE